MCVIGVWFSSIIQYDYYVDAETRKNCLRTCVLAVCLCRTMSSIWEASSVRVTNTTLRRGLQYMRTQSAGETFFFNGRKRLKSFGTSAK